jgi:hypothetical protein
MTDQSHLDRKYFIDLHVYNCPFCNRRNVEYHVLDLVSFHWTAEKKCYAYIVRCSSCNHVSMHLTYEHLGFDYVKNVGDTRLYRFEYKGDLDERIFYSVPTSFFVMDERIPRILRELITEADGSLKMNFLTGASACARKAIYELLLHEKAVGESYEDRIKSLKAKYTGIDPVLFDVLAAIQDMTSDKVHEQSWVKWDSPQIRLILETLKSILDEIYVVPDQRAQRAKTVREMREAMQQEKKTGTEARPTPAKPDVPRPKP